MPTGPEGVRKPTRGAVVVLKNPKGYDKVMLLPIASAPPAVVLKVN